MKIVLFVALLLISIDIPVRSSETTTNNTEPTAKSIMDADSSYASKPFDLTRKFLPARYKGHNPVALNQALLFSLGAKTEFETTDDYNKRAEKLKDASVWEGMTLADTFAFSYTPTTDLKYDAEKQRMNLNASLGFEILHGHSLYLRTDERFLGTYTAQNAYGASVEVSKRL